MRFGCPRTVSSFSIGAGIGATSVFARNRLQRLRLPFEEPDA